MATNKNQHFVPRCYLRPFTVDAANLAINLYNIDNKRVISNAPVKNQCSRDYFYGKNEQLERAIQHVEVSFSKVQRKILSTNKCAINEADEYILKVFWLFQYLRTEAATKRSVEVSRILTEDLNEIKPGAFSYEISDAVQTAMHTFADNMNIVSDLKLCLIKNNSSTPFITSDDPAILTNRWHLINPRRAGTSFGLRRAGALALLPLSPEIYMIAYDGDLYSIPNQGGWISIRKDQDVDSFNQHQYLNCRANIFIQSRAHFEKIANSFEKVRTLRLSCRHRATHAALDRSEGPHRVYKVVSSEEAHLHDDVVVHTESLHPNPASWPSQLQWRNKACVYTNGTGHGYMRKAFTAELSPPFFYKEPAFIKL